MIERISRPFERISRPSQQWAFPSTNFKFVLVLEDFIFFCRQKYLILCQCVIWLVSYFTKLYFTKSISAVVSHICCCVGINLRRFDWCLTGNRLLTWILKRNFPEWYERGVTANSFFVVIRTCNWGLNAILMGSGELFLKWKWHWSGLTCVSKPIKCKTFILSNPLRSKSSLTRLSLFK